MSKERRGYIGKTNDKWFARITFTDSLSGKRKNIKRMAKTESDAKKLLKEILKKLESESEKVFEIEKITFNNLADYYEKKYCQPAEIVNGSKVSGLRSYKDALSAVKRFRAFFGNRLSRSVYVLNGNRKCGNTHEVRVCKHTYLYGKKRVQM